MLYRRNPKTNENFSEIGFGAMRLPTDSSGNIDEPTAKNMLLSAINQGLNYIDTGYDYHNGESEKFIGRTLSKELRDKVFITTKLPSWHVETESDMEKILDEQLQRLQTDHIDYYMLIALSQNRWKKLFSLNVLKFLDKAKAAGKIRHAGFSYHGDFELFKEILDSYDWDLCQIQYNYLDENWQAGTRGLKYAASKGIGVAVMMPLRGGHLAEKLPADIAAEFDKFEELNTTSQKRSAAEWGYRWVLNHPEVTVVLSGMSSQKQTDENMKTASTCKALSMTDAELKVIQRVAEKLRAKMKISCSTCGYCMPCPNGVDIPSSLSYYNNSFLFNDYDSAKFYYNSMLGDASNGFGKASDCVECGKCAERCPQGLNLIEVLKDVAAYFE